MSSLAGVWLLSLLATLLIEAGIVMVWRLALRAGSRQIPVAPLLWLVVGLNLLTHSMAWSARLWEAPWLTIECGVFVLEWLALWQLARLDWRIAGLLSLAMNTATAWAATIAPWWFLSSP